MCENGDAVGVGLESVQNASKQQVARVVQWLFANT